MKSYTLRIFICVILLVVSNITVSSSTNTDISSPYDSVHISLLTCSPHNEVYSLYGHTAVRFENHATGEDFVVNYGVFDFSDKMFIPKFAFGITDYLMGVVPYYYFVREYSSYGSSITQQEINLTSAEKEAVAKALAINYLPENRVYRYNCFYKNCSTMARDIITSNINGKVQYPEPEGKLSFREMTHQCNDSHPWAKLGNDMLLGVASDFNTSLSDRQFLPANLMNDFDKAEIVNADGTRRPLVKSKTVVLESRQQSDAEGFPLSPLMCSGILFVVCAAVCLIEIKKKQMTIWFDVLMMTLTGLSGIVILIMFFSQHPTTSTNLLILMLNPLPLFFIRPALKAFKAQKTCRWWKIWAVLGVLAMISGLFLQDFDDSMLVVDAVIIIRAALHIMHEKKMKLSK